VDKSAVALEGVGDAVRVLHQDDVEVVVALVHAHADRLLTRGGALEQHAGLEPGRLEELGVEVALGDRPSLPVVGRRGGVCRPERGQRARGGGED
jgi:hypothetical protein